MVIKEDQDRVRVLRLANPPSNVLNRALLAALTREVAAAEAEPKVRCLVLASAYPRYFSSGLDLAELTSLAPERQPEHFDALIALYRALLRLPKPTVAAISGSALLGGWILAMACDYRIIAEGGRIALSEVRMGLTPTGALIGRLRRIGAPAAVKEMVLRGKMLRADAAFAAGLVDAVAPAESLEAESSALARSLSKLAPTAYAAIKRALQAPAPEDSEQAWAASRAEVAELLRRPDVQDGLAAMRDKRKPSWESADV